LGYPNRQAAMAEKAARAAKEAKLEEEQRTKRPLSHDHTRLVFR